ncbi:MAG TPA: hypothetical protein VNS19_16335 [Acidimicrobiales bacterium]|nr:hypothetical protein [Acidimicrobiales bacterium]
MPGSAERSREDHVAAATAALVRYGPLNEGQRLPAAMVSRMTGLSRSTLYQRWGSMAELSHALLDYAACEREGWRERLIATPPEQPIGPSVDAAVAGECADMAIQSRTNAAGLPVGHPQRERAAAAERDGFARLGQWLAAHLAAHGRSPAAPGAEGAPPTPLDPADLAIVFSSLVEGDLLRIGLGNRWQEPAAPDPGTGLRAGRLLEQLSRPDPTAAVERPGPPPPPTFEARDVEVFEALIDGLRGTPAGSAGGPPVVRMVDLARLARQLGVSERRLYALWPTPTDLNLDLARHQYATGRAEVDRRMLEVVSTAIRQEGGIYIDLFISVMQETAEITKEDAATGIMACTFATRDPLVAELASTAMEDWRQAVKMMLVVILQSIGYHLAPGVEPDPYTDAVFSGVIGSVRSALLHTGLLDRTVPYRGVERPLLAAGLDSLFRSLTKICTHDH